MVEIGMLGTDVDFDTEYRKRNVGHLMGKQESFANELRPEHGEAGPDPRCARFPRYDVSWRRDAGRV